jgi:Trypsin
MKKKFSMEKSYGKQFNNRKKGIEISKEKFFNKGRTKKPKEELFIERGMDYGIDDPLVIEEKIEYKDKGEGQPQNAFIFKLNECSSVLIHPDWLLTSQKCVTLKGASKFTDGNGNLVYSDGTDFSKIRVIKTKGAKEKPLWRQSLKLNVSLEGDELIWRKIEHIVMEPLFAGDGTEFLGGDIALVKLSKNLESPDEGYVAPICLADLNFEELSLDSNEQLYFAGFGRRRIQFCVTNMKGPDNFNFCGRSKICSGKSAYMEKKCPLEFPYKNKTYAECLTIPNPSLEDPMCINLAKSDFFNETAYVLSFDMQKVLATCIPATVQQKEKGWCTTQGFMDTTISEPSYSSGWGFCGSEEDQLQCSKNIDDKIYNTEKIPVSRFNDRFCLEQLENNLKHDMVKMNSADEYLRNIFCVGKNVSNDWKNVKAYRFDDRNNTFLRQNLDTMAIETLVKANVSAYGLDGIACMGDPGGPLFKYVDDNGIQKPLLVGLFSFMLWGTCRGKNEPSYFLKVKPYMENFIFKYIPKNETCIVNPSKVPSQQTF